MFKAGLFLIEGGLLGQGQVQRDTGTAAINTVTDSNSPSVGTDHALTDSQPEPGPLPAPIATGGGVEHVENLRPIFFRDARALIADRKPQLLLIGTRLQHQLPGRR